MGKTNTNKKDSFNYNLDVVGVLDYITSDKYIDMLSDAIYAEPEKIKESILEFLLDITFPPKVKNASMVVEILNNDEDYLQTFVSRLTRKVKQRLDPSKKKDLLLHINHGQFWEMYGASIKKCLGRGSEKKQIPDNEYFDAIPDALVKEQKKAHYRALQSFNTDAREYSFEKTPGLELFLHRIQSQKKSPKKVKKDIHRVEKQTKRIIQLYGLKGQGRQFDNGQHMVPKQFAKGIIKTCVKKK